jgi:flagellar basal-body rod protein FlgC
MSFNLNSVLDISGSSMSAQSGRLNTIASNIANADSESSSAGTAYKARKPVFAAVMRETGHMIYPPEDEAVGVQIVGIVESDAPSIGVYKPDHPLADKDGMVYGSNVNVMEEMADMISASRAYQDSVMVATTGQELLLRTLDLLR